MTWSSYMVSWLPCCFDSSSAEGVSIGLTSLVILWGWNLWWVYTVGKNFSLIFLTDIVAQGQCEISLVKKVTDALNIEINVLTFCSEQGGCLQLRHLS